MKLPIKKILLTITTCAENIDYLKLSLPAAMANETKHEFVIFVLDFSSEETEEIKAMVPRPHVYVHRSGKGFCNNLNYGIAMGLWLSYDYIAHVNDDAVIPPYFIDEGVNFLEENWNAAFVAGVQQTSNGGVRYSAEELSRMMMPPQIDVSMKISNLKMKWGDFSAWIAKAMAVKDIRYLDEVFDPVGIMADNDWVWRLRRANWECYRNFRMSYLHAKGVTQRRYRPGWPNDEVTKKVRNYFIAKWGVDAWSNATEAEFDMPFNRKEEWGGGVGSTIPPKTGDFKWEGS